MVLFLVLAVPALGALGALAWQRVWRNNRTGHHGTLSAFSYTAACATAFAYVLLTYGASFYDFTVVQLSDVRQCSAAPDSRVSSEDLVVDQCFLLGHFENRYILIGKGLLTLEQHRIFVKQIDRLEPFAIAESKLALRNLVVEPEYLQRASGATTAGAAGGRP
jgi:hypothetical protein